MISFETYFLPLLQPWTRFHHSASTSPPSPPLNIPPLFSNIIILQSQPMRRYGNGPWLRATAAFSNGLRRRVSPRTGSLARPRPRCKSAKRWILSLMKRNDLHYPIKVEVWRFHTDESWWVWRRHFTPRLWEPGECGETLSQPHSACLPGALGTPHFLGLLRSTRGKVWLRELRMIFERPSHIKLWLFLEKS